MLLIFPAMEKEGLLKILALQLLLTGLKMLIQSQKWCLYQEKTGDLFLWQVKIPI